MISITIILGFRDQNVLGGGGVSRLILNCVEGNWSLARTKATEEHLLGKFFLL